MFRFKLIHCITTGIAAILFAGMMHSCTSSTDGEDRKIFNLNIDQGITSLDPAFARNQTNIWGVNQLFNGLLQLNDSLQPIPSIAKSFKISADGMTYTFILREDVFFHDHQVFTNGKGRKVLADDFVYSFRRIIDPKVASSGAWIFNDKIDGPQAFTSLNDTTFQIQLNKPFPPMPGLLAAHYCSVVPKEATEFYGKDFRNNPVGTGPFTFKYWKEGEIMVFLKNENYFEMDGDQRLPHLDAIKISFIGDKQTAFLEFLKKNLDFFNGIDGSYRDDILTKSGKLQAKYSGRFQLVTGPYLNTEYLGMLVDTSLAIVKSSPLKDVRIRKAINYAINREKMVKYLRNSMGTPGHSGFIPQGMPGYVHEADYGYKYNPNMAKQLLEQAGYPNGMGLPEITLHTTTTYRDLIEFVQGELSNVGIKTKVQVNPGSSLRELISKQGVNFFRGSWIADYPDAENYLSVFYTNNWVPAGPNYTHFSNKQFDKNFEKAYFITDDETRYELYKVMDRAIMEESPVVILFYDKVVNMYQNNITGFSTNPLNLLNLKRVKKD